MMVKAHYQFNVKDGEVEIGDLYTPIPSILWIEAMKFFIYYSKKEVESLVYINKDLSGNKYMLTVPRQSVTTNRIQVRNQLHLVDLVTGEYIKDTIIKYGSIHSHHSMSPEFSTYDDQSDFENPPGIHIVVGNYPSFQVNCSIVIKRKRYYVPFNKLFSRDAPLEVVYNDYRPHDNVISQILAFQPHDK